MSTNKNKLTDMSLEKKRVLLKQILSRKEDEQKRGHGSAGIREDCNRFEKFQDYRRLIEQAQIFKTLSMDNPYFSPHEGVSDHITQIDGKRYINYSGYNYLGLSGHPEVSAAAQAAIDMYGTSVSASRIVSGEIP